MWVKKWGWKKVRGKKKIGQNPIKFYKGNPFNFFIGNSLYNIFYREFPLKLKIDEKSPKIDEKSPKIDLFEIF